MWIMNLVWPITALFGTVGTLWLYFRFGRLASHAAMQESSEPANAHKPFPVQVAEAAGHCGSGCTLGDICAEWLAFLAPAVSVWFGWHWLFGERMFAVWVLDFVLALGFGLAFQYFTIKPMRDLSATEAIVAAAKADVLSLSAWQVGMYGFMAFAAFYIFRYLLGAQLETNSTEFWFCMQIAMICGFITAYPVNWYLIRSGIKEAM